MARSPFRDVTWVGTGTPSGPKTVMSDPASPAGIATDASTTSSRAMESGLNTTMGTPPGVTRVSIPAATAAEELSATAANWLSASTSSFHVKS